MATFCNFSLWNATVVVNFDVCKWPPKLICYRSNIPRATTKRIPVQSSSPYVYQIWKFGEDWS